MEFIPRMPTLRVGSVPGSAEKTTVLALAWERGRNLLGARGTSNPARSCATTASLLCYGDHAAPGATHDDG